MMSPKAQGLVSNTHHSKTCMEKHCAHDRMSGGKTTKRHNSGSVGKKTTSSDEINHSVVSLLPTEEDSSRMSSGKGAKRTNSGSAVKKTTFSDERNHDAISLLPQKEDSSRWVSTLECCAMIVIDKDPNKGLLFDPNTGSNLGHPGCPGVFILSRLVQDLNVCRTHGE